jgi:hypothetical protein
MHLLISPDIGSVRGLSITSPGKAQPFCFRFNSGFGQLQLCCPSFNSTLAFANFGHAMKVEETGNSMRRR